MRQDVLSLDENTGTLTSVTTKELPNAGVALSTHDNTIHVVIDCGVKTFFAKKSSLKPATRHHHDVRVSSSMEQTAIALSSDGKVLAVAADDGSVCVLSLPRYQLLFRGALHSQGVTDICVSADGQLVCSTGRDRIAIVWDARSGAIVQTIRCISAAAASGDEKSGRLRKRHLVRSLRFARSGHLLFSGESSPQGGWVTVWQWQPSANPTEPYIPVGTTRVCKDALTGMTVDEKGESIAVTSSEGHVAILCMNGLTPSTVWNSEPFLPGLQGSDPPHILPVTGLRFAHSGRFLVTASADRSVAVWDIRPRTNFRWLLWLVFIFLTFMVTGTVIWFRTPGTMRMGETGLSVGCEGLSGCADLGMQRMGQKRDDSARKIYEERRGEADGRRQHVERMRTHNTCALEDGILFLKRSGISELRHHHHDVYRDKRGIHGTYVDPPIGRWIDSSLENLAGRTRESDSDSFSGSDAIDTSLPRESSELLPDYALEGNMGASVKSADSMNEVDHDDFADLSGDGYGIDSKLGPIESMEVVSNSMDNGTGNLSEKGDDHAFDDIADGIESANEDTGVDESSRHHTLETTLSGSGRNAGETDGDVDGDNALRSENIDQIQDSAEAVPASSNEVEVEIQIETQQSSLLKDADGADGIAVDKKADMPPDLDQNEGKVTEVHPSDDSIDAIHRNVRNDEKVADMHQSKDFGGNARTEVVDEADDGRTEEPSEHVVQTFEPVQDGMQSEPAESYKIGEINRRSQEHAETIGVLDSDTRLTPEKTVDNIINDEAIDPMDDANTNEVVQQLVDNPGRALETAEPALASGDSGGAPGGGMIHESDVGPMEKKIQELAPVHHIQDVKSTEVKSSPTDLVRTIFEVQIDEVNRNGAGETDTKDDDNRDGISVMNGNGDAKATTGQLDEAIGTISEDHLQTKDAAETMLAEKGTAESEARNYAIPPDTGGNVESEMEVCRRRFRRFMWDEWVEDPESMRFRRKRKRNERRRDGRQRDGRRRTGKRQLEYNDQ